METLDINRAYGIGQCVKSFFFKFYVFECFVCMYISAQYANLLFVEVRRGTGFRIRVVDGCKLPCGYWDLNGGPLGEQPCS